jgi:hypothetical protein
MINANTAALNVSTAIPKRENVPVTIANCVKAVAIVATIVVPAVINQANVLSAGRI